MKWIPDETGRFPLRPYYATGELDGKCEMIVEAHLRRRRGEVRYPIATEDLHVLLEHHGASVDAYADLSAHGANAEGMTEFFPDRPPLVSISKNIAIDPRRENRLRTTLAHEFGHVYFHKPLYDRLFRASGGVGVAKSANSGVWKDGGVLEAPKRDWMEWQAGYVLGAVLMPASAVRRVLAAVFAARTSGDLPVDGSDLAHTLAAGVCTSFAVSSDAARIRLLKLGLLQQRGRRAATGS